MGKGLSNKQVAQLINISSNLQKSIGFPVDNDVVFIVLVRICRDYISPSLYPLIQGEARDKWFLDRLARYRLRYFGQI